MAARWHCPNRFRCSVARIQNDLESKGRAVIGAPYKAIGNRRLHWRRPSQGLALHYLLQH